MRILIFSIHELQRQTLMKYALKGMTTHQNHQDAVLFYYVFQRHDKTGCIWRKGHRSMSCPINRVCHVCPYSIQTIHQNHWRKLCKIIQFTLRQVPFIYSIMDIDIYLIEIRYIHACVAITNCSCWQIKFLIG